MKHFEPGQPVLFRHDDSSPWNYSLYNRLDIGAEYHLIVGRYAVMDKNILPYNDNTKHLVGTDDNYTEWEPEPNTIIAVRNEKSEQWRYRLFLRKDDKNEYVCLSDNVSYQRYLQLPQNSSNPCAIIKKDVECCWQQATSIEESLKD